MHWAAQEFRSHCGRLWQKLKNIGPDLRVSFRIPRRPASPRRESFERVQFPAGSPSNGDRQESGPADPARAQRRDLPFVGFFRATFEFDPLRSRHWQVGILMSADTTLRMPVPCESPFFNPRTAWPQCRESFHESMGYRHCVIYCLRKREH